MMSIDIRRSYSILESSSKAVGLTGGFLREGGPKPMDFNKFTEKSQEAVGQAQALATRHGQQQVDVEHLAPGACSSRRAASRSRILARAGSSYRHS